MGFDFTEGKTGGQITFEALLDQRNANPPNVTELSNPNGYTYNVSYLNPGIYEIQFTNKTFDLSKTTVYFGAANDGDYSRLNNIFDALFKDQQRLAIRVLNISTNTLVDNALFQSPIFIREYP